MNTRIIYDQKARYNKNKNNNNFPNKIYDFFFVIYLCIACVFEKKTHTAARCRFEIISFLVMIGAVMLFGFLLYDLYIAFLLLLILLLMVIYYKLVQ